MVNSLIVVLVFLTLINVLMAWHCYDSLKQMADMYIEADKAHKGLLKILKFKRRRRQ